MFNTCQKHIGCWQDYDASYTVYDRLRLLIRQILVRLLEPFKYNAQIHALLAMS